jgi:hypothetical protein
LTFLLDPAVRRLEKIIKHGQDAHALRAIQLVLERNELYGYGVERQAAGPIRVRVTTQVKTVSAIHAQSPSDNQFAPYRKLIEELRELAAAEEPKTRAG